MLGGAELFVSDVSKVFMMDSVEVFVLDGAVIFHVYGRYYGINCLKFV